MLLLKLLALGAIVKYKVPVKPIWWMGGKFSPFKGHLRSPTAVLVGLQGKEVVKDFLRP